MYRYLSSIRHAHGSSLHSLFARKHSLPSSASSRALASRYFPLKNDIEHVRGFSTSNRGPNPFSILDRENLRSENDGNDNLGKRLRNLDSIRSALQDIKNNSGPNPSENDGNDTNRGSDALPFFMWGRDNMSTRSENDSPEKSYRPMDFVRGIIEEDGKGFMSSPYAGPQLETDADFVHIKMLRNNTFVTITDPKGNIKLSGSAGSLKEMKSGQKLSRYAAEATAEVVGRRARGLGLKAVVMKVNGFTHFRRKRQAIMSWLEGFNVSRGDRNRNPVVYIEDTTRKPHNGCRLPKKRRI